MKRLKIVGALILGFLSSGSYALEVDSNIENYEKIDGISGNLSSVGSDTLANLMTLWAESFRKFYPSVNVQIQAAGSSTAPPALIEGTSNFGPMSRKMKSKESEAFEAKYGYKATPIPVAIDALAVFVNKDNPIEGLDIKQVDAIFSATRKCGGKSDILTWGDAGVKGSLSSQQIQLKGKTLGIIGAGPVGIRLAKIASGIGMKIIIHPIFYQTNQLHLIHLAMR